ncbi:MAG: MFS transporter [Candidatus Rokubacteria bacterium]|nr:MFS transporter [Candidatus Rokubacteria bacterium]
MRGEDGAEQGALSASAVVRRYYAVSLVYALAGGFLAGGVYPLFLRSRGLGQLEINSVLAVYFAVTFLTDVPTGAFADALGRRRAFVLGCALRAASFALYFVSHAYVLFLVAEAIDALGTTFCNGAVEAWGVDTLDQTGFVGRKDRLFSRLAQLASAGAMIAALVGSAVGSIDLAWTWPLGAAGFLAAALVGGTVLREPSRRAAHVDVAGLRREIVARIGTGLRQGVGVRPVRLLSLAGGVMMATWAAYWLEWPILFKDGYGVGVWVVGWISCLLSLGQMIGSEIAARTTLPASRRPQVLSALVIVTGALLSAAAWVGRPRAHDRRAVRDERCAGGAPAARHRLVQRAAATP